MTFENEKKTFLSKLDKSKKGEIDTKIVSLINTINSKPNYYTTSSCSGRVHFWSGTGKKNETEWLNISHDLIYNNFFENNYPGLVWLRLEAMILHIACKDIDAANLLLDKSRSLYKKSCILSASNKIIVEIRGSEFIEMPYTLNGNLLFNGDINWLKDIINEKLNKIWINIDKYEKIIKKEI